MLPSQDLKLFWWYVYSCQCGWKIMESFVHQMQVQRITSWTSTMFALLEPDEDIFWWNAMSGCYKCSHCTSISACQVEQSLSSPTTHWGFSRHNTPSQFWGAEEGRKPHWAHYSPCWWVLLGESYHVSLKAWYISHHEGRLCIYLTAHSVCMKGSCQHAVMIGMPILCHSPTQGTSTLPEKT